MRNTSTSICKTESRSPKTSFLTKKGIYVLKAYLKTSLYLSHLKKTQNKTKHKTKTTLRPPKSRELKGELELTQSVRALGQPCPVFAEEQRHIRLLFNRLELSEMLRINCQATTALNKRDVLLNAAEGVSSFCCSCCLH